MQLMDAGDSDFELIRKLLKSCELYHTDLNADRNHHFLLAWEADVLIGTVGIEFCGESALLRSLAVAPNYRRRGVGTKLVNAIESSAKSRQIRTLYLLTLTAPDFFVAQGYQQVDRKQAPAALQDTTEFKNVCPASAVCMTKTI